MPDLSVVIPTHNRSDLLLEALRSCLRQPGPELELIVVDDGSTDDTERAVAGFDGPVRYVRQEWAGRSAARNRGAALAAAGVLAFLDSDDLALPGRFERQLARLDGDAVGVWGQVVIVGPEGEPIPDRTERIQAEAAAVARAGATPERLAVTMRIYPSALLVRKADFEALGGFDESYLVSEDVELILRLARRGRLAFEPQPVAAIRNHPGNSPNVDMFRAHVALADKLVRLYPGPEDRAFRARLLFHKARALWALRQAGRARAAALAALREDASVAREPGFLRYLAASLPPQAATDLLRSALRARS